jgi:hypothetical protein
VPKNLWCQPEVWQNCQKKENRQFDWNGAVIFISLTAAVSHSPIILQIQLKATKIAKRMYISHF